MAEKMIDQTTNLDPADWDELRSLGHQMVDDLIAHLSSLDELDNRRQPWPARRI